MNIRFIEKSEYESTKELAEICFGFSDDLNDYYEKDVYNSRIASLEDNGKIFSMVHLKRMIAVYGNHSLPVWYIFYVCTLPEKRHMGYMDSVMNFVLETLKKEGEKYTFLVPVDEKIYEHLGFLYSWNFNPDEKDILYADDDLEKCFAHKFFDDKFTPPLKLKDCVSYSDIKFTDYDEDAFCKFFDYFFIRPNMSCDSIATDTFIWQNECSTKYFFADERCLMLSEKGDGKTISAALPFCKENELVYYFKLQEKFFNMVLKIPHKLSYTDRKGTEYLKKSGALENYTVCEEKELFDYIYLGDDLRNLPGRKFSKKRNHINNFKKKYKDRWEYRRLGFENAYEIISFLKEWESERKLDEKDTPIGYKREETLRIEMDGLLRILKDESALQKIKIGGIFIDGKLCAFSAGSLNAYENMAVIDIEKAFSEYDGLYQMINREFLINEFGDAKYVNREDDIGIPGLRKSKMSYNPVILEKRYSLVQNDF